MVATWFLVLLAAAGGMGSPSGGQARSLSLSSLPSLSSLTSLLGLIKPEPDPRPKYPIWKIHKYKGVDLHPLTPSVDEPYPAPGEPRQVYGDPPTMIDMPTPGAPASEDDDTRSALEALDSLGPLASFLPGDGGGDLASLLNQGTQAEEKLGTLAVLKKKKKKIKLLALLKALKKRGYQVPLGPFQDFWYHALGLDAAPPKGFLETVFFPGGLPAKPSLLSFLPSLPSFKDLLGVSAGGEGKGIQIPALPALPPIPEIPHLQLVPKLPALPGVNLPTKYHTPLPAGAYVSIRLPKPQVVTDALPYAPEEESPEPFEPSIDETPELPYAGQMPPVEEYSPPATSYGVPYSAPVPTYSPPQSVPQPIYVPPQPPPVYPTPSPPAYSPPSPPVNSYGTPIAYSQSSYSAPDQSYQQYYYPQQTSSGSSQEQYYPPTSEDHFYPSPQVQSYNPPQQQSYSVEQKPYSPTPDQQPYPPAQEQPYPASQGQQNYQPMTEYFSTDVQPAASEEDVALQTHYSQNVKPFRKFKFQSSQRSDEGVNEEKKENKEKTPNPSN